jgi:hypothetical protein
MARDRSESSETIIVSTPRLFSATLIGWPLAVASVLAGRTAFVNAPLSPVELAGWAFAGFVPVTIALLMSRSRATMTVAEVLYNTEHERDATPTTPVTAPRG